MWIDGHAKEITGTSGGFVCSRNEVLISDFFVINLSKEIEHS